METFQAEPYLMARHCNPEQCLFRGDAFCARLGIHGAHEYMEHHMNKTFLAIALSVAGLAATPVFAQSASNTSPNGNYLPNQPVGSGNWFIDANIGRTNGNGNGGFGDSNGGFNFLNGDRNRKTGYGLVSGYRWKVGQDMGLGLEAGYTDLGNFRVKNVFESDSVDQRTTNNALRGWMLGVNGRINLIPQWYLAARGGYFLANSDGTNYNNSLGQDLGLSHGGNSGRGGWYAGLGTGWDISENWGLGVHYDYYHVSTGKVRDNTTGMEAPAQKRSTGIVSLMGEYRF